MNAVMDRAIKRAQRKIERSRQRALLLQDAPEPLVIIDTVVLESGQAPFTVHFAYRHAEGCLGGTTAIDDEGEGYTRSCTVLSRNAEGKTVYFCKPVVRANRVLFEPSGEVFHPLVAHLLVGDTYDFTFNKARYGA